MSRLRPGIATVRGSPGHARSRRIAAPPAPQAQQRALTRCVNKFHLVKAGISMSRLPAAPRTPASARSVIARMAGVTA